MRISGFSSGMDIDSMVKDLMKAHRLPIDKLKQKKTLMEWQREDYRQINSKLVDFRNNKLFQYSSTSTFSAKKAIVTGDANVLSAKVDSKSLEGSLTIQVTNLATAASVSNTSALDTTITTDTKLIDLINANKLTDFNDANIVINGSTIAVDKNTDTISSLISKINNDAGANVTAFYDTVTGKLSLSSKATGNINGDGRIAFAGDLLTGSFGLDNHVIGLDAVVKINGVDTTRSSNTFTINGVEISLSGSGTTNVQVTSDVDKVIDQIKSFVQDYNGLIASLNDKLKEQRYRDFLPLTSDQKNEMKEKEIDQWEEKAKSGLLRNDGLLTKVLTDMRLSISKPVTIGAEEVDLSSIGITTGKYFEKGALYIDEVKLRQALTDDPDKVTALFTAVGSNPDRSDKGVFERLKGDIQTTLNALSNKAGTSAYSSALNQPFNENSLLSEQLRKITSDISLKNSKLAALENKYYKQFNATEQAMSKYQAQSASLFSSFNTGE